MTVVVRPVRPAPTAYYWLGKPNFGDRLTPLLMGHFTDLPVAHAPIAGADMIGVGSLLHLVPEGWRGIIAGSGKLWDREQPNIKKANVLGIRGPLSARGIKGDFSLGDPGLLANELVDVPGRYHELGVVPHWSDNDLVGRFSGMKHRDGRPVKVKIIRPDGDPLEVIRDIGMSQKIVASSLHGIILADAFGIPRRIETTPRFKQEGGMFKFQDHNAALHLPFKIGVTQAPARHRVQERQHEIFDMLHATRNALMGIS